MHNNFLQLLSTRVKTSAVIFCLFDIYADRYKVNGGGWVYLFICLSAGAVEWESSGYATTLLHHAPLKVTSVLVPFVIFVGLFQLIGI